MMRIAGGRGPESCGGGRKHLAVLVAAWAAGMFLVGGCGDGSNGPNPSGTLEATEIDLGSPIGGKVLEVRPRLGDPVAAGDTLVVFDVELIRLQRAQAEANRKSIEVQRQLAGEDLRQARRGLELAQTTLARVQSLHEQGSATRQQLDDLTAKNDLAAIQAAAARERLKLFEAEEAKLAAALAVFDRQLEDGALIAPSVGTILVRAVEPGELAIPGSTLLRLADLKKLELRVFLGEQDLDRVRLGQEVPVLVDALKGEERTGTVTW
ncbi:MAG: efflux RND transporter periplasmic adaptor subunit, partial [Acidobacteriota bacterium]